MSAPDLVPLRGPRAGQGLSRSEVRTLYHRPLLDLVFEAAQAHRAHHDARAVQCAALLSIKTGGCPEDCAYCPQSAHHHTGLERESLLDVDAVVRAARAAQHAGADRFCLGAAWRHVRDNDDFEQVLEMIQQVKELGLETCVTLGMVQPHQAERLAQAGLDYYNHNLDTSRDFYSRIISTRTYDERLTTLENIRAASLRVCCGGIVGMGETDEDRSLLWELARQDPQPESVPINALVAAADTPLAEQAPVGWEAMVRMVAAARVLMPKSDVRLSAGRAQMSEEAQAMCFLAGANSIFLGEKLLTAENPDAPTDRALLDKLGLQPRRQRRPTRPPLK